MMQRVLIGVVKGYRLFLSPWLGSACRFEPPMIAQISTERARVAGGRGEIEKSTPDA